MSTSDPPQKDPPSVTVRPSKKALQRERQARLTKALRDNLGRRKSQIRGRSVSPPLDDRDAAED